MNRRFKNEIVEDFGDYVSLDISTGLYPDAIMLIDKEGLSCLKIRWKVGRVGIVR